MNETLTKNECAALRALAIVAIMLHNYCHFFSFTIKENEYTFHAYYNHYFWDHVFHLNSNLFLDFWSYLGHYGVPVFLFISGYGLVQKYESGHKTIHILPYIGYHYLKLLRLMLLGFIAFIIVDTLMKGEFRFTAANIAAQLAMIINLFPSPDENILPGPYWYFGMSAQLYVIYRLLFFRRHWSFVVIAILLCWSLQIFLRPTSATLVWMRYNCIGSMLPFGMGLLFARYRFNIRRIFYLPIFVLSLLTTCLFCANYQLWFFIPLFIITLAISLIKLCPHSWIKPLASFGSLSAMIFVIHPILRPIFLTLSIHTNLYFALLMYVASTFILAYFYKLLLKHVPLPILKFT